ncbi:hypothetical protein JW826_02430 [Candidatus Woesearchaeota archaeon]|nr:hypothetical protein [Candidatus Woesearchaeota archaeon]
MEAEGPFLYSNAELARHYFLIQMTYHSPNRYTKPCLRRMGRIIGKARTSISGVYQRDGKSQKPANERHRKDY